MKRYGWTNTNLRLTAKAQEAYDNINPLEIWETDNGAFFIRGAYWWDNLTEEDVNDILEELLDMDKMFGEEVIDGEEDL